MTVLLLVRFLHKLSRALVIYKDIFNMQTTNDRAGMVCRLGYHCGLHSTVLGNLGLYREIILASGAGVGY